LETYHKRKVGRRGNKYYQRNAAEENMRKMKVFFTISQAA
ncbi:MAG: hypothetical protein ACI85U_003178, partial [Candidatus Promineifilaceae bacterium]